MSKGKFEDNLILFLNGHPFMHSENLEDICCRFLDECNEFSRIELISYYRNGKDGEVIEGEDQLYKHLYLYGGHGGMYGLVCDESYDKYGEEFNLFILDGSQYSVSEMRQGIDGYSGEDLYNRLVEYCAKNNIDIKE